MNWLEKIASPEAWLSSQGIPTEFIVYALDDNKFPRKIQKWVAINLTKRFQASMVQSFKPHVAVGIYDEELIEIRDWYNYKSRREQGFDINRYDMDSATRGVHEWQSQMEEERGQGHVRDYQYPRGQSGREYEELGDGFIMVEVPAEDLANEGAIMQHCVGDDEQEYTDQVHEGTIRIFSLRDSKGWPHATIEVEDLAYNHHAALEGDPFTRKPPEWSISQVQGKQNETPVDKYKPYLRSWFNNHEQEFNIERKDFLQTTPDSELVEMIYAKRMDSAEFSMLKNYLSDDAMKTILDQVMQDL